MRTYALLTLSSALLFTAASAANASPALQANPSAGAAAPVQVADSSRPAPAAAAIRTAPAAVAEEKKICKQLPSSYTRSTKRVCLTKAEWEQVGNESR